jgi:hypothetical protein
LNKGLPINVEESKPSEIKVETKEQIKENKIEEEVKSSSIRNDSKISNRSKKRKQSDIEKLKRSMDKKLVDLEKSMDVDTSP